MTTPTPTPPPLDVVTRARAVLASGMAAGKPREVMKELIAYVERVESAHRTSTATLLAKCEEAYAEAADLRAKLDAIVAARTEAKPMVDAGADDLRARIQANATELHARRNARTPWAARGWIHEAHHDVEWLATGGLCVAYAWNDGMWKVYQGVGGEIKQGREESRALGLVAAWNAMCDRSWHGLVPADRAEAARLALGTQPAARTEAKPAAADDPHGLGAWWKRADTSFAERWNHVRGSAIGRISSASLWTAWDDTGTRRADNVPTAREAARLALGQPAEPVTVGAIDWLSLRDAARSQLDACTWSDDQRSEIVDAIDMVIDRYHSELVRTGALRTGGG